jgi:MFS family permease
MGIIEDTNLPSDGFSNLAMVFYVSFLVFEPLQTYFIQRFPVAKWLGANVFLWGITVACNSAVSNYASVVALRVLLGVMEASVAPSLIVITSMWYLRSEQTWRMGIWYLGTSIGPVITSLASYGFLHYTTSHPNAPFKSWQILFLVYGLVTITVGICVILFLPDNPMKSRFSNAEKLFIINRIRGNETGIENKSLKGPQVKEVFLDIRTWIIALIVIATNVPNGAVSSFQSIIISGFGFDEYETLLLGLPSAAVAFITTVLATYWAGRCNARCVAVIILIIPTLIGGALMAWLPADNKAGLLAGNYLTNTVGSSLPLLYSWITANYAGHSKKTTMSAIVLMSFCVGNIIGPKTFVDSDAPAYIPAKICIVAFLSGAILLAVALEVLYAMENRRRDRMGEIQMPDDFELMDLTDKENLRFRYLL